MNTFPRWLYQIYTCKSPLNAEEYNLSYNFLVRHHLLGYVKTSEDHKFWGRRLILEAERKKVLKILKSNNIPFFELKGVVLEKFLQENIKDFFLHRFFGDLDIYIPKRYLPQVLSLFEQAGFNYEDLYQNLSERVKKFGSLNLKKGSFYLDLHFDLNKAGKYRCTSFSEKDFFSQLLPFYDSYILPSPYYFPYLLFHFVAKHHFYGWGRFLELLFLSDILKDTTFYFPDFKWKMFYKIFNHLKKDFLAKKTSSLTHLFIYHQNRTKLTYFEKRLFQLLLAV